MANPVGESLACSRAPKQQAKAPQGPMLFSVSFRKRTHSSGRIRTSGRKTLESLVSFGFGGLERDRSDRSPKGSDNKRRSPNAARQ